MNSRALCFRRLLAVLFWAGFVSPSYAERPATRRPPPNRTAPATQTRAVQARPAPTTTTRSSQSTSKRTAPTTNTRAARQPTKARTISSAPDVEPSAPEPVTASSFQAATGANPRFLFSSGFGVHVLAKPGLALQAQMFFAMDKKRQYYLGPDITYTLFSPGTSLTAGLGGWYDMRIYGAPRLSCIVGLVAGPVFNAGVVGYRNVSYAVLLDLALVQEVDDLISVKGQFRPGILGSTFTYVMSFQVAFRFL